MKRIGVAVGQPLTGIANPLTVINAQQGAPDWTLIGKLIKEWQPSTLIVGIPYNMDGTSQKITIAAQKFARELENHFDLPVHGMDERLTTRAAYDYLHETETSGTKSKRHRKRRDNIDSIAAKIILESWFAKQPTQS